jgi:hypothetical protein
MGRADDMAREKRKQLRRYLEYRAHIDFGDGSPARACLLADVSETGARLTLDGPSMPSIMPTQFMLLLAGAGNARRRCRVVWSDGRQLGVRFMRLSDEPLCLSVPVALDA